RRGCPGPSAGGHRDRRRPGIRREMVPQDGKRRHARHPAHDQPIPRFQMMDVLSVTSEIYPLVKTGGLADVAGALPAALSEHDIAMRTLVPGYPQVVGAIKRGRTVASFEDLFGGPAQLIAARVSGLDLIVLDAPHLYDRSGGIYVDQAGLDWPDNWQRFGALSWVAAEL